MVNLLVLTFILLQVILLFFIALHDWVHVYPLTDIHELKKHTSMKSRLINSIIYAILILIPLVLTLMHRNNLKSQILIHILTFYGLLSIGTILSWWIPYFLGSSKKHKSNFIGYRNTHTFLPARGDNVRPNTFHVILHLQIWICFIISLYLFFII